MPRRRVQFLFSTVTTTSITNKLDDLLDVRHDLKIDVLFLIETWHDADAVSFRRLRTEGLQVVDRLRPRSRVDTLTTNHGGVADVAVTGVQLTMSVSSVPPSSCCASASPTARHRAWRLSSTGPEDRRTGLVSSLFNELSNVLDRVVTYVDPIYVFGDINIRLDRPDDPDSRQFT